MESTLIVTGGLFILVLLAGATVFSRIDDSFQMTLQGSDHFPDAYKDD